MDRNVPTRHPRPTRRTGFTLVELLVVMAVIALLLAILLPALQHVRSNAKKVASKTQLVSISQACESYAQTFGGAYPGYLHNDTHSDVNPPIGNGPGLQDFTGTENLVISLMGRVVHSGSAARPFTVKDRFGNNVVVDLDAVGIGPQSRNGTAYEPFFSPQPGELRAVDGTQGGDNDMPEICDPQTGMPVLYIRAGSSGVRPASWRGEPSGGTYDGGVVQDYTQTNDIEDAEGNKYDQAEKSLLCPQNLGGGSTGKSRAGDNLAWIVVNPGLSDLSDGRANDTDDDVAGGRYVLISAGPDGYYLSEDQNEGDPTIDSKGDLQDFDDQFVVGGS